MKNILSIGCLLIMLFLSACGLQSPGNNSAATPEVPEKTEMPVTAEASAPPESSAAPVTETAAMAADAPAQSPNTEPTVVENTQQEEAPAQEIKTPAPAAVTPPAQASNLFTGVMGTEFVVPDGFTQLDESPNIGYQYTFWHPDYEIRIEVSEIAPGYLPEDAWETDYRNASNNPDVTYFKDGESWFVESGYQNNGETIFYAKESATDGGLKSFRITYPTAKREFGDSITAEFEKNCRF